MFWRFGGYANISTIDTLLDKANVSLEELLDESDLIQELKAHNTKLIEFLRDVNTLKRLLNYVIAPASPPNDADSEEEEPGKEGVVEKGPAKARRLAIKTAMSGEKHDEEYEKLEKQRLKYAYVACEILSSETWSILEALMSNIPHLTRFWDFIRRDPPLDPLQAGYFTKVNETLLEKKTEDMLEFFKNLPNIVPAILQHVDCPMIMDLLLKIISLEKQDGGQGIVDWLQSQHLIPTLLSHLSADQNSSTQTSAGDFLKAIITISANAAQNEQSCIGPNGLTRQLVSEPCMQSLVESMLQGGNPLTVGVGIVIEVIRKNNSDYDPENGHNPDAPPTSHDPIYLGTLLRMFAEHVPDFMQLILSSKHTITEGETTKVVERGNLSSAWGTQIEPLGFDRFKTCELMAELLHCSNMGLLNEKGSEEFVRQRDAERERLFLHGNSASPREEADSAVDISEDSSRFTNGLNAAMEESPEDLRITNSSEEDGFEKVIAPGDSSTVDRVEGAGLSDEAFTEIQSRAKLDLGDDFVEEPLSSPRFAMITSELDVPSPLHPRDSDLMSPTTTSLAENVRRVSLEDTAMATSSEEEVSSAAQAVAPISDSHPQIGGTSSVSPYSEITPAPLFSRSTDPNKTPTPLSPNFPVDSPTTRDTLTQPAQGGTFVEAAEAAEVSESRVETEVEEKPVVGDYLKIMFVKNKVVPTILTFFFRFPWNNFLHNVVYDVVQQVFNGPMDRGFNRDLAIDLFESGGITDQIVAGQKRSDESQQKMNMRLGYMGHLTLVAEEVVKFSERHPAELLSQTVMEKVLDRQWIDYVEQTLSETRERDNAILGGVRPDTGLGPRQAVLNAVNAAQGFGNSSALANAGLTGGIGAQQSLDSIDLSNNGSASGSAFGSGTGSLLSGFGSSSDDEDEEMDEAEEEERAQTATQLQAVDTNNDNSDQPVPLIPPPPAPLNIPPSRARRQLAARLALHQQQAEVETAAVEREAKLNTADDPFSSLGDTDENDPFTLDEEEEDITASGNRNKRGLVGKSSSSSDYSNRGLTNLFSTPLSSESGHRRSLEPDTPDDFYKSMEDSSSSEEGSTGSDEEGANGSHPLEPRRSLERRPLEIEDDEDDEMGEMVAPTEDGGVNSSDEGEEEVLSPIEKEKLRSTSGAGSGFPARELARTEDEDDDEGLVEIAMPAGGGRLT